jgi:hypothetical protein
MTLSILTILKNPAILSKKNEPLNLTTDYTD